MAQTKQLLEKTAQFLSKVDIFEGSDSSLLSELSETPVSITTMFVQQPSPDGNYYGKN